MSLLSNTRRSFRTADIARMNLSVVQAGAARALPTQEWAPQWFAGGAVLILGDLLNCMYCCMPRAAGVGIPWQVPMVHHDDDGFPSCCQICVCETSSPIWNPCSTGTATETGLTVCPAGTAAAHACDALLSASSRGLAARPPLETAIVWWQIRLPIEEIF